MAVRGERIARWRRRLRAHSSAAEEFMRRDGLASGTHRASNPSSLSQAREGDCRGLLFLEQPWTADERIAPNIKSQGTVRLARNADPDALSDFAGLVIIASEP
jgi:hypothetical protein